MPSQGQESLLCRMLYLPQLQQTRQRQGRLRRPAATFTIEPSLRKMIERKTDSSTEPIGDYRERSLLDDLTGCKSGTHLSNSHFDVLTRFGLRDEDDETFHPGDAVASAAGLFDVNFVLLAFFNWFVEGSATESSLGTQQIHLASESLYARTGKRSVGLHAYTLRLTASLPL